MGLEDLISKQVAVEHDGGRYLCHPPNIGTVHRLHALFAPEIEKAGSGALDREKLEAVIQALAGAFPDRAAAVLATCVDPPPRWVKGERSIDVELCTAAVLTLCDVGRIAGSLIQDMNAAPDSRDSATIHAVQVARLFNVSPLDAVNEWPYEALLTILDALDEEKNTSYTSSDQMEAAFGPPVRPLPLDMVS